MHDDHTVGNLLHHPEIARDDGHALPLAARELLREPGPESAQANFLQHRRGASAPFGRGRLHTI
jgi:hypothetical protein